MSLNSTTKRTGPLPANGATTSYSYTFKIYDADDMVVTKTDASGNESTLTRVASSPQADEYTVSGVGDNNGGTITTGSTYASGITITMSRNLSITQGRAFKNTGGYRGETHELALDELTMMLQQIDERMDRALIVPVSDDSPTVALPAAALRAGKTLTFDSNGDVIVGSFATTELTVNAFAETFLDDADGAAVFDTLIASAGQEAVATKVLRDDTLTPAVYAPMRNAREDLGLTSRDYLGAPSRPLNTFDVDDIYQPGSMLTLNAAHEVWFCIDDSTNAAEWSQMHNLQNNGDLLYGNATAVVPGATAALPIGTNGQEMYVVNGLPSWQWGGFRYVEKETAADDASIEFTDLDQNSDHLFVFRRLVPATDNVFLYMHTSPGSGVSPTYDETADYHAETWGRRQDQSTTTIASTGAAAANNVQVGHESIGNLAAPEEGISGSVVLEDVGNSAGYIRFTGRVQSVDEGAGICEYSVYGHNVNAAVVQAVRFTFSSGNISTGVIEHWQRRVQ